MKWLFLGLLALFGGRASAQPAHPEFWQGQSIYQIVTDRFENGDLSNDNADGNYNPKGSRSPHGGDFRGVEQKLDYVKALGATAIWISPVVLNGRGEYHGYAGRDFFQVDPRWGTMEDLRHMVAAAHARGLLVIDDVICNHGADLIDSADRRYRRTFLPPPDGYALRYRNLTNTYPPPFDLNATNPALTNLFHNQGLIHDYSDRQQVLLGELSGLDDFRTESPYVRAQMERIYEFWIEQAGFDGFRIDTVKHVELSFWQEWCPAIRAFAAAHGKPDFFMFGEALDGSDKLCGSYTGRQAGGAFALDAVLDYPLYFKTQDVFARHGAPPADIARRYDALAANYDPAARDRLVTFLDNHDQPRFLSHERAAGDIERLRQALVFLYTSRGIPCLYYGAEQGFDGGNDPNDREDMFAGAFKDGNAVGTDSFNMTHPLFRLVAELNNLRRLYPPLRLGDEVILAADTNNAGPLVYARRRNGQEIIVALNTDIQPHNLANLPTACPPGTRLINVFDTNEALAATEAGSFSITVPAGAAAIYIPQPQWQALDPVVIGTFPFHDATNMPVDQAITFDFSEPMDTNSVQRALTTIPPVAGALEWSPTRAHATFTPATPFPTNTIIYARLADSARGAASGKTMRAPFETRFRTGPAGAEP